MTPNGNGNGAAEEMRQIAADYQAVFGTEQGRRVLDHIMTRVLLTEEPAGPGPGDRAAYIVALHDVALSLRGMLNMSFLQQPRPNLAQRPQRFSRHPAYQGQ